MLASPFASRVRSCAARICIARLCIARLRIARLRTPRLRTHFGSALILTLSFLLLPAAASATIGVKFDLSDPAGSPFPTDRFTVRDWTQTTQRRVNLPKPDCTARPSDCADIDVLNTLDGFSSFPRITVPFTGDINPSSVTSETVFLVALGDVNHSHGFGRRIGINQIFWDPSSRTLAFKPEEQLAEHSRYLLVVTTAVRDTSGNAILPGRFDVDDGDRYDRYDWGRRDYRNELRLLLRLYRANKDKVAAAAVFTTQTVTSDLRKIIRDIKRTNPSPVDFTIGASAGGPLRAVFPVASLTGIQWNRQTGTAPAFTPTFLPTPALGVVPGAVAAVAYGRFRSPDYQTALKYIPATGSATGRPQPLGSNDLIVQMFIPSAPKPAGGWPVAIFGHGFTDSMYGAPWAVASIFAAAGIATVSINIVGHGGGTQSSLTVLRTGNTPVQVSGGGRGFDQDGNGTIDSTEGVNAAPPFSLVGSRDGLRQSVIDLAQLVRQIEIGIDVDGDGSVDFNARRIYYAGQSFGGIYGTTLLAVEPNIQVGVPNVPGGSVVEAARLGAFRILVTGLLATRQPQLLNVPPTPGVPPPFNLNFNENIPLRNQPPLVNIMPGAVAIQQVLDHNEWAQQSANPVAYAPYLRKHPLHGNSPKRVIIQFAKGDQTVPNPAASALIRAGELADRATYFRNDLAYALDPAVPKNPHTFLTAVGTPSIAQFAAAAQQQIAVFFASDGNTTIDPDGAGPFFETPVNLPLPETLNFIP